MLTLSNVAILANKIQAIAAHIQRIARIARSIFPRIFRTVMRSRLLIGCILLMVSLMMHLLIGSAEPQRTSKKLLEYGWDVPTPDFFRQHIKQMEQHPFDGVIVKLNVGKEVFIKSSYPNTAFTQDRKNLAATTSSKLTDNFVLMWSSMEYGWDWFNDTDWAATEKNISNFAKTAKAGRFKGIAFDPEPYTNNPWNYETQRQHDSKTFEEYQKQVRKRGAQFMKVLQTTQPRTEVFNLGLLSWMKYLLEETTDADELQKRLVSDGHGLWPAFINGMLDAVHSDSIIIDGNERAYYSYCAAWFAAIRKMIQKDARALVDLVNHTKYDSQVKIGQAVYIDLLLDLFKKPANNVNNDWYGVRMPHFLSPNDRLRLLEHNTYYGLRTADKYVWIYSEAMDWWQNRIPRGAENAIRRAKAKIQKGEPLGFNIETATEKALKKWGPIENTDKCWQDGPLRQRSFQTSLFKKILSNNCFSSFLKKQKMMITKG
ncbi:hypothetical protein [Komarekiella delphini-convector]|uniref:hypothetical protein n=1 Tax=Komarekiella delphini-convector TaxID=3050158 RepID=UPI001CD828B8|nr:hypothetical protein [Komarekiella delphini-convector]